MYPPFDELGDEQLADVVRHTHIEFYPAGTEIVQRAAAPSEFLYVVRKGLVHAVDGEEIADVLGEGEFFGFVSIFTGLEAAFTIRAIEDNKSVIVSAPTGAGKTLIAEYAIERCIERKARVIYTSPIKTLSNQKFRDFRASYGDAIGIMTGDVTINPNAPVLIMTTEIFRNTLFESAERFHDASMVIMDEIHYIGDEERGSVWEESIIFAPKSVRFVGLSATISNLEQFRTWVEKVCEHPVDLVKTEERPVPLLHFLFVPEVGPSRISDLKEVIPLAKHRKKNRRFKKHDVLDLLQRERKLPCLFFCFSRRECEAREFDVNERVQRGLGAFDDEKAEDVELRFSAKAAPYILERPWHAKQVVTEHADGTLTMKLRVAHSPELEGAVLRWAGEVEVVSPAPLRRRIGDLGEAVARMHRS